VTKEDFDTAILPAQWFRFVIIRDLRDTLISGYFSIKFSHPPMGQIAEWRAVLNKVDLDQGLLFLMKEWLPDSAAIQQSWLNANEPLLRYEVLLKNDLEILKDIIIKQAGMQISTQTLEDAIISSRFESVTGGRHLGQEDLKAHERKGIAGDWKNHFSSRVKDEFKQQFGALLIKAGYEKYKSW
jgi:lipopolysaccharide transport system ATP-binding protein